MSDLNFQQDVASLLKDILAFLVSSLKEVNLPKKISFSKQNLINRVNNLKNTHPDVFQEVVKQNEFYEDVNPSTYHASNSNKNSSSFDPYSSEMPNISPSELVGATIQGYLVKKPGTKGMIGVIRNIASTLVKKYCVLKNEVLYVYESANSKKPNAMITLKEYKVKKTVDKSKKENSFELVCPDQKTHYFSATSESSMDSWIEALKNEALKRPTTNNRNSNNQYIETEYEEYEGNQLGIRKSTKNSILPVDQDDLSSEINETYDSMGSKQDIYDDISNSILPLSTYSPSTIAKDCASSYDDNAYDDEYNEDSNEDYDDVTAELFEKHVISPKSNILKVPIPHSIPSQNQYPPKQKLLPNTSVIPTQLNQDDLPYNKMYYSKWDCTTDTAEELPMKYGDVIVVISQKFDNFGWWVGRLGDKIGLVPRDYLTPAYQLVG